MQYDYIIFDDKKKKTPVPVAWKWAGNINSIHWPFYPKPR